MRHILMLLMSLAVMGHAVDDDERTRLRDELQGAVQELESTQERLVRMLGQAGITLPASVTTTLLTRRNGAKEWERRVDLATEDFTPEHVDRFNEELRTLQQCLASSADLAEQVTASSERWPHCSQTPELARFNTFLRERLLHGLAAAANDASDPSEDETLQRQQRRHELLLLIVEANFANRERWTQVPAAAPALQEYRAHSQAMQTALERALTGPVANDDHALDRDEAILWLLDDQVQLVQSRGERIGDPPLAISKPALAALDARQAAEHTALQALITHQRLPQHDDAWNRVADDLREVRNRAAALTEVVWDWIGMIADLPSMRKTLDERLAEAPPTMRTATLERWSALDIQLTTHEEAITKALDASDRLAAIRAGSELELTRGEFDLLLEDLDFQLEQNTQDQAWREHAADPAVAAALQRLEKTRAAFVAARASQRDQELAARRAHLARRLAEASADDLRANADRARATVEHLRAELERAGEETANAVDNPTPEPEKDAKF